MRFFISLLLVAGCATSSAADPGAPSVESVSQETRVCGDVRALKAGDWIQLRRRVCAPLNAKSAIVRCTMQDLDRAEVVGVADARCATVRLGAGIVVRAGDSWTPATPPASAAQTGQ